MFLLHNEHVAVILLVVTQNLVLVSSENEIIKIETLAKAILNTREVPWMDRIDSVIRDSETACAKEIAAVSAAMDAQEMWALQMLDASSKIQSGILKGNVKDLGMYDQCVEVEGEYNGTNVQGQHCRVMYSTFYSSLCVPSSCSETELVEIINTVIQDVPIINDTGITVSQASCARVGTEDFTVGEIITIFFFSAVGAFIICCTICEYVKKRRPAGVPNIVKELSKFSLYTNAMAVLDTTVNPRMMPAIQGIRFLSICWIVIGHRYGNSLMRPMVNTLDAVEWYDSWSAMPIQFAPYAVDIFFVISGFLMTYLFLKSKHPGKISNFPMMYLHRYLRLTPSFAVLILFIAVLLHRLTNGPLWSTLLITFVEPCRKNWWVNLLYVQNFVRTDEQCMLHSWYLAADMQLFLISPFILYPLYRWPKWGLGFLCFLLVGSVATPAILVAINEYTIGGFDLAGTLNRESLNGQYTYNRAVAYFVGMLLGYDAVNNKRRPGKVNVAINWIIACMLIVMCLLMTRHINDSTYEYNVILETTFTVFLRPCWSIAIAWIVYACSFGYGGVVSKFFSLPIFLPLSRLSYGIYLMHMVIQFIKICAAQTPERFSDFTMINEFWGDLALSIGTAFILTLFFESPVVVLEKILTNRSRNQIPVQEPKKDVEGAIDNKAMTET